MKRTGGAGAAAVLAVAGVVTLLGSLGTWAECSTTPCGGFLQGSSSYSGLDLGFGVITALAGLILAVIGLHGLRRNGVTHLGTAAVLLALLIVVTAGASVIWMYVVSGEDYLLRYGAVLVGMAGLIALAASLRLRAADAVALGVAPLLTLLVAISLVAACSLEAFMESPHGVAIRNDLEVPVQVWYADAAEPVGQIEVRRTATFTFDLTLEASGPDCTTQDIVITSMEGNELARIPPPACIDRAFIVSGWLTP